MGRIGTTSLLSLAIFVIPVIITSLYKLIENSIGPVVLLYSVFGGLVLGYIWVETIRKRWNTYAGVLIGVPIGAIGMVLLLNFFILVTHLLGEMDYQLL